MNASTLSFPRFSLLSMGNLYDRLFEICRDAGIEKPKNRDIQELLQVSSGRITQIKHEGEAASLSEKSMSRLLRKGYRRDWVKSGIGPKKAMSVDAEGLEKTKQFISHIPVVGTAQLGDNGYWAELEYPVGHGDGYISWPSRSGNAYALRCRGDSMKPRIKSGEYVIVAPDKPISPGDEVLVKARDGRVMVKELLYVREGIVHLNSVNVMHERIQIPRSDIEAMHYVAGVVSAHLVDLEPPAPTQMEEPKPPVLVPYQAPTPDDKGNIPPYSF